jgi:hypothetical protein
VRRGRWGNPASRMAARSGCPAGLGNVNAVYQPT